MSVNVIIIAAIALVVMIILIVLVLRSGLFLGRSNLCESLGEQGVQYECVYDDTHFGRTCDLGWVVNPTKVCERSTPDEPLYCCIPLT